MTKSAGPEFPQSTNPEPVTLVDSNEALFDLEPVKKMSPIQPLVPSKHAPESRRSEAWDDIGNHGGPFIAPRDEDQVFAVQKQSPNPVTGRAVRQIATNRRFGLHGIVDRTPEQDENARLAAEQGHADKEKRDIAGGMSKNEARARRMIAAIRRNQRS